MINHEEKMRLLSLTLFIMCFTSFAERKFDFEKNITEKNVLEADDFSKAETIEAMPWTKNHGTWKIVDGKLAGAEIEAQNHGANISLNHQLPESYYFTCDFKLTKGSELDFSLLGSGGGKGLKVCVTENDLYLRVKGGTGILDWDVAGIDREKWHKLSILIVKDVVIASVNGKATVFGKHEKIGLGKKRVSIGTGNKNDLFDNVKLYSAKADISKVNKSIVREKPWTLKEFYTHRNAKFEKKDFTREEPPQK